MFLAVLAMACLVAVSAPATAAAKKKCVAASAKTAKHTKHKRQKKVRCKRPARPHGTTSPATAAIVAATLPGVDAVVPAPAPSAATGAGPQSQAGTAGGTTPSSGGATGPPPPGRLFAADSVWNSTLPDNAPVDPSSAARMDAFNADIQRQMQQKIGPWISERSNSTPFYVVGGDQPKVPVKLDSSSVAAQPLRSVLGAGVPIPSGAKPAAGVDAHLTIYQPSTDTMWEFWHASLESDGWHADWGGAMQHVSANAGYYSSAVWSGLSALQGWDWGSTASSLPMIAGTAMISELRAGHIDHALAINIPEPCKVWFSWPAQQTDGTGTDMSTCLTEGAHLRLDPNLDLSKLNLPPVTRMFAEAAQRYGLIVRDRTGAGNDTTFMAEDPTPTGTDPYRGPGGFYGTLSARDVATRFPWKSLQLLEMTACWKAPCLP